VQKKPRSAGWMARVVLRVLLRFIGLRTGGGRR
jgi:hypothetical protein